MAFFALFPFAVHAGEGCTCRATDGSDIAEGATACIRSPAGMTLARCEKVLNNTSWKFLGQPCPQAALEAGGASRRPVAGG